MGIARAVVQHGQGRRDPVRLDHHPAVREEHLLTQDADAEPQGQGTVHLASRSARRRQEGRDPRRATSTPRYYGRGAYGIQAAAQAYYGKDAEDLNAERVRLPGDPAQGRRPLRPRRCSGHRRVQATAEENTKRAKERWSLDPRPRGRGRQADARPSAPSTPSSRCRRSRRRRQAERPDRLPGRPRQRSTSWQQHATSPRRSSTGAATRSTRPSTRRRSTSSRTRSRRSTRRNIDPKKRPTRTSTSSSAARRWSRGRVRSSPCTAARTRPKHFTNNADTTGAQVGSTFKPFVLAAAMQYGKRDPKVPEQSDSERTPVSPKSIYNGNNKLKIKQYNGNVWHERGQARSGYQRTTATSLGLHHSAEGHGAVRQHPVRPARHGRRHGQGAGHGRRATRDLARTASTANSNPSFALGTSTPSAIRMADAYATFATSGKQAEPYSVTPRSKASRATASTKHERRQAMRRQHRQQRDRGAGERRQERHGARTRSVSGRAGCRQDRHHRREQVGLVRRLHPAALDRRHMFR